MPEGEALKFLHVGCGKSTKADLFGFNSPDWQEVRLDIDPGAKPDILASISYMGVVQSDDYDAVFSAHNIEHFYPHEVQAALKEFLRVLKPSGFLVVTCPDLEATCESVVRHGLMAPLYDSPMGKVTALDVFYGHLGAVASGREYMAHKGGFSIQTLGAHLKQAGFPTLVGGRRPELFDLWLIGFKSETPNERCRQLAAEFLPQ